MRARTRNLLLVAAVALVAGMILLQATPGSVLTERSASGTLTHREYLVAFVGLLLMSFLALGLDFRDWF